MDTFVGMTIYYDAVRGDVAAAVLQVTGHGAALFNLDCPGNQLLGAYHDWRI